MKNLLYILSLIMIISSCRSIDKMIESGNYDQALRYGVDKLRGEKNKKTKYVKGLEKAYAKLNRLDRNEIKKLKIRNTKNSMDRVVEVYQRMEKRQNYVYPLIPLICEDGYEAELPLKNYSNAIHESMVDASDRHYKNALEYIKVASNNNDKIAARKAHSELKDATYYFDDYKDSYQLIKEAYELGQTNILIEPYVSGSNLAFNHTGDILSQINISSLNTTWRKYYTTESDNNIDYVATIEVSEIIPGKETERYNSFTNTKEIVDGKKPINSKTGQPKRDTMGNIIYTEKRIVVSANVEELIRKKTAQMSGKLVIIDALSNNHITTIPINVTHIFEDYSCRFRGDKRALTNEYNKRIKDNCAPFPTDYEMTTNLAYEYKKAAENSLRNERLI